MPLRSSSSRGRAVSVIAWKEKIVLFSPPHTFLLHCLLSVNLHPAFFLFVFFNNFFFYSLVNYALNSPEAPATSLSPYWVSRLTAGLC